MADFRREVAITVAKERMARIEVLKAQIERLEREIMGKAEEMGRRGTEVVEPNVQKTMKWILSAPPSPDPSLSPGSFECG